MNAAASYPQLVSYLIRIYRALVDFRIGVGQGEFVLEERQELYKRGVEGILIVCDFSVVSFVDDETYEY